MDDAITRESQARKAWRMRYRLGLPLDLIARDLEIPAEDVPALILLGGELRKREPGPRK